MKFRALSGAVFLLALLPGAVYAAKMSGRVVNTTGLLNPVWNEAKDPNAHRYTFREPSSTVPPDARVLRGHFTKELCIAALGSADAPAPKKGLRIIIEGGRTSTVTLVVAPGQELLFENHDPTDHALYEVSGKGGLAKSVVRPDGSVKWTPPGPGTYELRDELSPSLRSWIVVEPKLVSAFFPTRKGELAFDLEPGTYELQGYFAGAPVGERMPFEVRPVPPEQPLKDPLKVGPDKKPADAKGDGDTKGATDPKAGG